MDKDRTLITLQFINPDGSKRFLKGSACDGLFHMLRDPKNSESIGIAESYVTAATCLELAGIPVICAFSSGNLPIVAKSISEMFPNSQIIIFADNDRHLEARGMANQGVLKGQEAVKRTDGRGIYSSCLILVI